MATSTPKLRNTPTGGFWTLVGVGAAETAVVNPPPPIASVAATSQIKLGEAAKSTADARRIANELSRIKTRPF